MYLEAPIFGSARANTQRRAHIVFGERMAVWQVSFAGFSSMTISITYDLRAGLIRKLIQIAAAADHKQPESQNLCFGFCAELPPHLSGTVGGSSPQRTCFAAYNAGTVFPCCGRPPSSSTNNVVVFGPEGSYPQKQ